jgi:hypothetical protein
MRSSNQARRPNLQHRPRAESAAYRIRQRIDAGGEHFWKMTDFPDIPPTSVSQTYSRLTREHTLQRVGKGIYYHPRTTVFGKSHPSDVAIVNLRLKHRLTPAGLTAANKLGFSTQNPACLEYATTANGIDTAMFGDQRVRIYTRRPESWNTLPIEDAALLDFVRGRGLHSELSDQGTKARLFKMLREPDRFQRLVAVAPTEPARVRAMLGAMGQEIDADPALLAGLRASLNPLSRFDFGAFHSLEHAREWQAK